MTCHIHDLYGCNTTPLSSYLAAIGVLRIVGEQFDPDARGAWVERSFKLKTRLDRDALIEALAEEYAPSPIVAPWNGGSGFYERDNRKAIETIESSTTARFAVYRDVIRQSRGVMEALGVSEKVGKQEKVLLLEACRATLPDAAIRWLDAAFVLSEDGVRYPPLLGTGGNDGRLDFTNNLMQRLIELIDPETGAPSAVSSELLRNVLFDAPTQSLTKGAIGQFLPLGAGGANAESGFDADASFNPWEYVLMLEGALLFAAASVRRLEDHGDPLLSAPFTVRSTGSGYASADGSDEASSRAEIWIPVWDEFSSFREVGALLAEGRAVVGRRQAADGVDFARAIAALGVDRGLSAFERYGFHVRNGLAYFATPLGRFEVGERPLARRIDEIDGWMQRFQRAAKSTTAPSSAARALRKLQQAILQVCRRGTSGDLLEVLVSLGSAQKSLSASRRWVESSYLFPVPLLTSGWFGDVRDDSVEFRLAASLAWSGGILKEGRTLLPFRSQVDPVEVRGRGKRVYWSDDDLDVTWSDGDLAGKMITTLLRRVIRSSQCGSSTYRTFSPVYALLRDTEAFISGDVDEGRLDDLVRGLVLIDASDIKSQDGLRPRTAEEGVMPSSLYALLRLCFVGTEIQDIQDIQVPMHQTILRRAAAGAGTEASRVAIRRLRACGLVSLVDEVPMDGEHAKRAAAALLFPTSPWDVGRLMRRVLSIPGRDEEEMREVDRDARQVAE